MIVPPPSMAMLPVSDLARSAAFYDAVFGWSAQPIGTDALMLGSGGPLSIVLIARLS